MIDVTTTDDGVATLRFAHGKANALDLELLREFADRVDEVGREAKALVLTGNGSIFSAGVDLPRLATGGAAYTAEFMPALDRAFRALFELPLPVVAAVDGHAIAGGCVLAACCDRRFAATGTYGIGVPELVVGVPFPSLALAVIQHIALPAAHARLLFDGWCPKPEEAQLIGLIEKVVAPEVLLDEAHSAARRLMSIPPTTFALNKRLMHAPIQAHVDDCRSIDDEIRVAWGEREVLGAVERYVERVLRKR